MTTYTVILDACVLYPAPLRSYLLYLAQTGLYRARWTEQLHDEWMRNAVANNSNLTLEKLQPTRLAMDKHVPGCLIEGYESLTESIILPDPDDRHVVAAAIAGQAEGIVTFNLKDFPDSELEQYELKAIHPDEFLSDMFEHNPSLAVLAAQRQRRSLRNPPMAVDEYLDCLLRQRLPGFVSKLKDYTSII
jgi:predicted nucleic acid-binding protein